jgi:hypothetical protein
MAQNIELAIFQTDDPAHTAWVAGEIESFASERGWVVTRTRGPRANPTEEWAAVGYHIDGKPGQDLVFWLGELEPDVLYGQFAWLEAGSEWTWMNDAGELETILYPRTRRLTK